ncbi:MAG: hypothetical protein H6626_12570 [Pseudobdellovibrionaceae bacterium]|nr:hypothetical protein [Bdellovibrionales bacterium]USN47013.1 MAG: hypothetical protein H6626_12570 [Pseudobdellovibrionaceae bacterium]
MKIQNIFGLVVIGLTLFFLAGPPSVASQDSGFVPLEDTLPWPWGTECPFPWQDIEGMWKMRSNVEGSYFEFTVISELEDGSRVFEVTHYNEDFEIIAAGRGLAPSGKRIVRAAMHSPEEYKGRPYSYWAIVRSYERTNDYGCGGDLVTAVTFRPVEQAEGVDHHYILEKVQSY